MLLFRILRKGFPETMGVIAGIFVLLGIFNHIRSKKILNINIKDSLFLSSSLIIASGLIVNSFLKTFSGRARPSQIDLFGGEKIFSPAFIFTDQCQKNCSFASGHSAFAFWLTALAMIAPLNYRLKLFVFFLFIGFLVGFTRIVQGGHFLSDVIAGGSISLIINLWLYKMIYKKYFYL